MTLVVTAVLFRFFSFPTQMMRVIYKCTILVHIHSFFNKKTELKLLLSILNCVNNNKNVFKYKGTHKISTLEMDTDGECICSIQFNF